MPPSCTLRHGLYSQLRPRGARTMQRHLRGTSGNNLLAPVWELTHLITLAPKARPNDTLLFRTLRQVKAESAPIHRQASYTSPACATRCNLSLLRIPHRLRRARRRRNTISPKSRPAAETGQSQNLETSRMNCGTCASRLPASRRDAEGGCHGFHGSDDNTLMVR